MTHNTRRQHYVWAHYLSAWATQGGLWCQRGDVRFPARTNNVAHRRDFYRLEEMGENDIAFLKGMAGQIQDPILREAASGWISKYTDIFLRRRAYRKSGYLNAEIERKMDVAINTAEERLHSHIENTAVPVMEELRRGDVSILGDKGRYLDFSIFIAAQYMRTPCMVKRLVRALKEIREFNGNADALVGPLRTMLTFRIGAGIFSRRNSCRLALLEAPASVGFVTGDQPVVNLRALEPDDMPPEEMELYYPLTPSLSLSLLLLRDGHQSTFERTIISVDEVRAYNRAIASMADEQIYAACEMDLESLQAS